MVGTISKLLNIPPAAKGLDEWSFWHAQDHQAIQQAVLVQKSYSLYEYQLDPLNTTSLKDWLYRHQAAHNDINSVLGLSGVDLENVDFTKPQDRELWIWLNFNEHLAMQQVLGI